VKALATLKDAFCDCKKEFWASVTWELMRKIAIRKKYFEMDLDILFGNYNKSDNVKIIFLLKRR
jgi:hypothetical protein